MGFLFLFCIGNVQMLDPALGKASAAIPAQLQFILHPPDHYGI